MEKFYTVDEIASMLEMHPKTIQRYIREGKLKANKVGKRWRVTGHDLSLFTEGTSSDSEKTTYVNESKMPSEQKIKISAVVDIDIESRDEAMRISSSLTAVLNLKPKAFGYSTMSAQFLESEGKLRIMLWGNISFMENMMSSISALTKQNGGTED